MNKEKSKFFPILAVVVGFFMLSIPMFAHHGSGISYDNDETLDDKGGRDRLEIY